MLASISGAKNVLEIGTFTGYSALCFAEGISHGIKEEKKVVSEIEKEIVGEEKQIENEIEKDVTNEEEGELKEGRDEAVNAVESFISTRKNRKDEQRQKILLKIESQKKRLLARVGSSEGSDNAEISRKRVEDMGNTDSSGSAGNRESGESGESGERRSVVTCEVDPTAAALARQFFDKSDYKDQVSLT